MRPATPVPPPPSPPVQPLAAGTGPPHRPRRAPPWRAGCSGRGERGPRQHHLPPARLGLRIAGAAPVPSATQRRPTGRGGTRRPEPSRPPPPRARTAVEGVDPGEPRQAAVAQRLHARRSAPPAGSHRTTKAARAGGGGPQAQAGAGWEKGAHGRLPGSTAALLPGAPKEGGAGWQWQRVPPPASASPGGAEPSVPRTQPRRPPAVPGDREVGTVAAWAPGCVGVPRLPRWHWGARGHPAVPLALLPPPP